MDTQIQSRLRVYSLVETFLRKAAAEVKPLSVKQLLMIPDIHRAAHGNIKDIQNAVRLFYDKDCLVNFSEAKTPFASSQFTWKEDTPTPKYRVQMRRTKAEREAAMKQTDLLGAAMGANVPNKPVGQRHDYTFTSDLIKPSGNEMADKMRLQMLNSSALEKALRDAGGEGLEAHYNMNVGEFLITLAMNNILINAKYTKP